LVVHHHLAVADVLEGMVVHDGSRPVGAVVYRETQLGCRIEEEVRAGPFDARAKAAFRAATPPDPDEKPQYADS
jgi:hypothetical protein